MKSRLSRISAVGVIVLLVALLGLAAGRTWIAGTMLKARLLGFGLAVC